MIQFITYAALLLNAFVMYLWLLFSIVQLKRATRQLLGYKNFHSCRQKFFYWFVNIKLVRKIFHVKEGAVLPRLLLVLYFFLFPLKYYYACQSNLCYEWHTNTLIVNECRYSMEIFDHFANAAHTGKVFKFLEINNAVITVMILDDGYEELLKQADERYNRDILQ